MGQENLNRFDVYDEVTLMKTPQHLGIDWLFNDMHINSAFNFSNGSDYDPSFLR